VEVAAGVAHPYHGSEAERRAVPRSRSSHDTIGTAVICADAGGMGAGEGRVLALPIGTRRSGRAKRTARCGRTPNCGPRPSRASDCRLPEAGAEGAGLNTTCRARHGSLETLFDPLSGVDSPNKDDG
jgi:hypothetical protein